MDMDAGTVVRRWRKPQMTTRRSFLRQMLLACTGAAILPSALTYGRTWKVAGSGVIVPEFILGNPPYIVTMTEWSEITTGPIMRRLMQAEYRRCLNAMLQSVHCHESVSASGIAERAALDGHGWFYRPSLNPS